MRPHYFRWFRESSGRKRHPGYLISSLHIHNDLTVYTLESALPASITPCKLLPANYDSYLSYLDQGRPPVMMLDQEEKALVTALRDLGEFTSYTRPRLPPHRLRFHEYAIYGDSSNPAFLILKDPVTHAETLVLLSTATEPNSGGGTFLTPQISMLNAMIVEADAQATAEQGIPATGLQVQTVDLSNFNHYTPPNPP